MAAASPAAEPVMRDGTYPAALAIHQLIDYVVEKPNICCGPWAITLDYKGRSHVHLPNRTPPGAVVTAKPAWTKFIWGPKLNDLASILWKAVAADFAVAGVHVTVPDEDLCKRMYWGPMPVETPPVPADCPPELRASWPSRWRLRHGHCMPGMAITAEGLREQYMADLQAAHPDFAEFTPGTPHRDPYEEEAAERLAARKAHEDTKPASFSAGNKAAERESAEAAMTWTPGSWGKGFQSSSGKTYTWKTTHPSEGATPQHSDYQRHIGIIEGGAMLVAGREASGNEDLGYACPIVIAPDGTFTRDSNDPWWSRGQYLGRDYHDRMAALEAKHDPASFSRRSRAKMRYIADSDKWSDKAFADEKPRTAPLPRGLSALQRQRLRPGD